MKTFGTRIRGAVESLRGRSASAENQPVGGEGATDQIYSDQELQRAPAGARGKQVQKGQSAAVVRIVMQMLVSLLVLGAGLYIVLSGQFSADGQKWAYGVIGVVVGYWLS